MAAVTPSQIRQWYYFLFGVACFMLAADGIFFLTGRHMALHSWAVACAMVFGFGAQLVMAKGI